MARVTDTELRGILDADCKVSLTPFIRSANLLVSRVATCATAKGKTLTDAELKEVELWLAAHFYTQRDPLYTRKKTERAEGEFTKQDYLSVAKMLDTSGCLETIISKKSVGLIWLGTEQSVRDQLEDVS